jgi:DNA modification methylase
MATIADYQRNEVQQLNFPIMEPLAAPKNKASKAVSPNITFMMNKTRPIHRWVPWIAGFSTQFVSAALKMHSRGGVVLDPFAGVGTTLLDAITAGCPAIGFEINPYAAFACRTKTSFARIDVEQFGQDIVSFEEFYTKHVQADYTPISTVPQGFRTRYCFYSEPILRKVLIVQDFIHTIEDSNRHALFELAFASNMIKFSNYTYEPSLSTRKSAGKGDIQDFPVGQLLAEKLREMCEDIKTVKQNTPCQIQEAQVINDSFFNCENYLAPKSIELVITSPPYLNNYHYNRNTRPQLYWLNLVSSPHDFKHLESENVGQYWQTVREKEPIALDFKLPNSDLAEKLALIGQLNSEKGIYGGKGWANYAATYFNDCYRFAKALHFTLKKGGMALVVIGNSILQGVMIPTDQYLGAIAAHVGLELMEIEIPRKERVGNSIIKSEVRVEKAQKTDKLYEAVVKLRKV